MTGLMLTLREPIPVRLDMSSIVPDAVLGLDVASIRSLTVTVDRQTKSIGELFDVTDSGRDELILAGDYRHADRIGGCMRDGKMTVRSSVGHHLADNMRGGQLTVLGNAGEQACSNLRGGFVEITGDCLDYAAGAGAGARRGMRGGTLFVRGNVGRFLGYRMRRGTVLVAGNCGPGVASYLIAGSLILQGKVEAPLAPGMRRGTILIVGQPVPEHPVGFTDPEPIRLSFLNLLLDYAARIMPETDWHHLGTQTYLRSIGDRASGGKGEVIWLSPSNGNEE